jgi:hypothetical protein
VCIEADFHLHDSELREMIQEVIKKIGAHKYLSISSKIMLFNLKADLNGNSLIERQEFISVMLRTNLFN